MKKKFKVIVIGSGPGGSVTTKVISDKGVDVLLIEMGNSFKINNPLPYSSDEMSNKYKYGGLSLAFGKTNINYAEGKCLGGGSEVNSGLYHRVPDQILKNWELKNNLKINRKELQKSYEENERELSVSFSPDFVSKSSKKMIEGCNSLGWKCVEVPRWFKYSGKTNKGIRQSMTETLIPKIKKNGGKILDNAKVFKITKRGKLNVIYLIHQGELKEFECEYLFVCGGSINSPFLLQKSGFKGGIGKGLKLHPSFKITALFKDEVYSEDLDVSVHQVKEFSPKISMGSSISNKHWLGLSLNDSNSLKYLDEWKKMSSFYTMISPEGSGRVWNVPFFTDPLVTYKLTNNDYYYLNKGINLLSKLLFESGAVRLFPSGKETEVISKYEDTFKINIIPKNLLKLMTIHLFSSIQISGNKKLGPLNQDGRLWNDDTIYVNDGSILPDSPSVNPQGIIMALARINANKFLNRIKNEF